MRHLCVTALLVICALGLAPPARAVLNAVDNAPAATLLLPYFEVDPESPGRTTLLTVHNTRTIPVIAHATIYTDFAVGSVAFDIDLEPLGSASVDLADIFRDNSLGLGVDTPNPGGSTDLPPALFATDFETGDLSDWDVVEARTSYDTLLAWHTGEPSPRTSECGGINYPEAFYRGFVFIDAVSEYDAGFQDDPGYFAAGGTGRATNENTLTGEFELRDDANNFAQGNALIHVEAGLSAGLNVPGNYTFYSRFNGADASDNREPLGSAFGARYLLGSVLDRTSFIYWRDPKVTQPPFNCGAAPIWYPMSQAELAIFDEDSNSDAPALLVPFPAACGRVEVGSPQLPTSFDFGWIRTDFNAVNFGLFGGESQGVLLYHLDSMGRFSTGQHAIVLRHASSVNP
jgi:hypothetical protein